MHAAEVIVHGWADAIWETGREFGTIGVQKNGLRIEITTFRAEAYDGITRNPVVAYGTNLLDDLRRHRGHEPCRRRRPSTAAAMPSR